MAQSRIFSFHSPETARKHNTKVSKAFDVGVYSGYFPRVNAVDPAKVDLILGQDATSALITEEGVRVEESANVLAAVTLTAPHPTLTRFDLIVAEYQFTTNTAVAAVYKVVAGSVAPLSTDPIPLPVAGPYQVPIAYARIAPGAGPVVLTQTDLLPVVRGQDVDAGSEIGSLKARIDPTDTRRLYVHGGLFYAQDGLTIIDFRGGYSSAADLVDPGLGSTNYQAYALNDGGEVVHRGTVSTFETTPALDNESVPLVVVEVTNPAGTPQITRIRDIRSALVRRTVENSEIEEYRDMLASTTFTEMVVEPFVDDDNIDFTTLGDGGLGAALDVSLDTSDSSLTFTFDGSVAAVSDVEIVIGDLLAGASLSAITDFAVVAQHDLPVAAPSLEYDRSFTSAVAGFSGVPRDLAVNSSSTVEQVVATPASFFLKLIIPASLFPIGPAVTFKIFSIGLMTNTDPETAQLDSVLDDANEAFQQALKNSIGNPFQIWTHPSATEFASLTDNDDFIDTISISAADISGFTKQFGPDGWITPWTSGISVTPTIKRVVAGSVAAPSDIAYFNLEVDMPLSASEDFPLEYRIPFHMIERGKNYSFAVDASSSLPNQVGVQIIFYKKTFSGAGTLATENATPVVFNSVTSQRILVSTAGSFQTSDETYAIGFRLVFRSSGGGATTMLVGKPMATSGGFTVSLPYVNPDDALEKSQRYVYLSHARLLGFASEGTQVGFKIPHPTMYSMLGTLRASLVQLPNAQNSSNVGNISVTAGENDVEIAGNVASTGAFVIDSLILNEVLYERV